MGAPSCPLGFNVRQMTRIRAERHNIFPTCNKAALIPDRRERFLRTIAIGICCCIHFLWLSFKDNIITNSDILRHPQYICGVRCGWRHQGTGPVKVDLVQCYEVRDTKFQLINRKCLDSSVHLWELKAKSHLDKHKSWFALSSPGTAAKSPRENSSPFPN
jgi:hypothetical protein